MDSYSDLELKTYIEDENNDERNDLVNGEIHSNKYFNFFIFLPGLKEIKRRINKIFNFSKKKGIA